MRRGARPPARRAPRPHELERRRACAQAVVDLYGTAGFDLLCVTDHVVRGDDPWPGGTSARASMPPTSRLISRRSSASAPARAGPTGWCSRPASSSLQRPNPDCAGHAVAVGLHSLVAMDDGPAAAMEQARAAGAADSRRAPPRLRADSGRPVPDVLLRSALAGAARALRSRGVLQRAAGCSAGSRRQDCRPVARGDLHRAEQLPGWTTLVPCGQDGRASTTCARTGRCS
jgi:hypothetical protein